MKKILVVEDDKDTLEVVEFILTSRGFDVHTHSTGLNVPEVVTEYHPDLILLDIFLPGKLGTQICKELKEKRVIPIILFSAHADKQKALEECHADAFIQKPFDIDDLISTINLHLN